MKTIGARAVSIWVLAAVALGGCTTINPFTGETQTSKTTTGAVAGSVIGAILGAATADRDERKKRALQGAGIGAIAGAMVGSYMDKQEAELRRQLEGTGVGVTRSGNNIILNMPGNVTFDTDSSSLKPSFFAVLDSVGIVLNKYESTLVTIAGHTDSTGPDDYNQRLSEQRATTVATYLLNRGVATQRMAAVGYGESRPIATNATPEGRALNRRVEITLDPISQ